jgi:uncharacterized phage infection (PIP) family protein YhgE
MDKEINGHLYIANDNLKRIADALDEILRLVKEDQKTNEKYKKAKDQLEEKRIDEGGWR